MIGLASALLAFSLAQDVKKDVPYGELERQILDIHAPKDAQNLPVVFWIHGGGWQTGDKTDVQIEPQAFMDKGFVFVSTNYRLLPDVDMGTIVRDVAKAFRDSAAVNDALRALLAVARSSRRVTLRPTRTTRQRAAG